MGWLNMTKVVEEWQAQKKEIEDLKAELKKLKARLDRRVLERKC